MLLPIAIFQWKLSLNFVMHLFGVRHRRRFEARLQRLLPTGGIDS
jgi:hypothetical protein